MSISAQGRVFRRYLVEFVIAVIAYAVVLIASIHLLNQGVANPWKTIVALTPVVPLVLLMFAVVRYVNNIDELQRQIHLEAFALSAGITAALSITYAFLESAGLPHVSAWWTFVSIDVFWGLSLPFVTRRYK